MPQISIGLPVYNGDQFLEAALDSILAQTFHDFELIISDNASTDKTEDICQAYAARDQRIRYHRNQQNLGAARNHNRVVELSRGNYFKWISHDDVYAPDYLAQCVAILDQDKSVVLCHSKSKLIDQYGNFVAEHGDFYEEEFTLKTDSSKVQERFYNLVCITHDCLKIFGLIRADILKTTPLLGGFSDSDRILLARLALTGRFYEIPEPLFLSRRHANRSSNSHESRRVYTLWFAPERKGEIVFPHWRIFREYLATIKQSSLSWRERTDCFLYMGYWLWKWKRRLVENLMTPFPL